MFTANDQTSTDYLVKTINVTVYEKRKAWAVAGKTDKTVTACAVSRSLSLDLTSLSYEDQYSNIVKHDSTVAAAVTSDVSVALYDPNQIFVAAADAGSEGITVAGAASKAAISVTGSVIGNNLVLNSNAGKGDATLFFRYVRPSATLATGDDGLASSEKYDLKLTISATNVGDMTASDLKLVVNNGNAICASAGVTLEKSDVTNPDNQDGNDPAKAATASVYVTGVVNGKTVVIPSSQYHLVTKSIGSLGAYDAKNNDKTETKTVTVVVDSESGAQELTADVTVSNNKSAITTVKTADKKGELDQASSRTLDASDFIGGIKVLDQYGNKMDDQDAKFRYEVTLTGTSADYDTKITGQATQDIKIEFLEGGAHEAPDEEKITATVKYTTLDGKITFTQDVNIKLPA